MMFFGVLCVCFSVDIQGAVLQVCATLQLKKLASKMGNVSVTSRSNPIQPVL